MTPSLFPSVHICGATRPALTCRLIFQAGQLWDHISQRLMAVVVDLFRRQRTQRKCQAILAQWHAMSIATAVLQQQGRSAAQRLQALRLRQSWQIWRRAHCRALAARQQQYSKMVYELLKVCQQCILWVLNSVLSLSLHVVWIDSLRQGPT